MQNYNNGLILLKDASKLTPYSADYLSLLVRKGRLEGFKKDGKWYTTENAVKSYLQRAAEHSYEHQQSINVKIPAAEIKRAKVNFRWSMVLVFVILIFALYVWRTLDEKRNENIRSKYRITEDREGNITIFADDPSQIKSVKVMQKN